MKLPDKIYVLMDESTGFLSHTFTNVPCEYEGAKQDIAYIRKDALLEWLNSIPPFITIQEVINKINSL